jgi:multidrug resistance protein, MATE family
MRNLMLCALAAYGATLATVQSLGLGNAGLWIAFVAFLGARGLGQAIAFPALARRTFTDRTLAPLDRAA